MITMAKPEYLINALEECARSMGMPLYRLISVLEISDDTYDRILSGNLDHAPPILDALMRFTFILGLREANPAVLINATPAEMNAWTSAHSARAIELYNEFDSRWRTELGRIYRHMLFIRRVFTQITLLALFVAACLFGAQMSVPYMPPLFQGIMILAGMVSLVTGGVAAIAWWEVGWRQSRYQGMKAF